MAKYYILFLLICHTYMKKSSIIFVYNTKQITNRNFFYYKGDTTVDRK